MLRLKSAKEIETIRASSRIAAEAMLRVQEELKPGVTTADLDQVAACYIRSQGAVASALGYQGFPKSICISINNEIVHGIPGERIVEEGDILAVDIAVLKDGYHGDMNVTMALGKIDDETRRLVETTSQATQLGLEICTPDKRLGDVGHAIQAHAEAQGYSIVREYCGHGIGRDFHEEPQLLHYGIAGTGRRLQAGMVLTIEPMVNQGSPDTRLLNDNWTAVTADGKLSAQFEHTVAISANGPDILTRFDDLPF